MSLPEKREGSGFVHFFTDNSVAANVLMVVILGAGLATLFTTRQEVFPEFSLDIITISVPYPGATPSEVEESIATKIEEAVQGVDGIKRLRSSSNEGAGVVTVEVREGEDVRRVLDDVKTRVDAIDTFPADAEEPVVQEILRRNQVLNVAIAANSTERTLRELGERVRDEITALPGVSQADLVNVRDYEISIEVSETDLRRYGLTFDEVARAVRGSSLDLPGGSIKTDGGEILLRGIGQAYTGEEFAKIVLLTRPDGTRLTLGDIATVVDGFVDVDRAAEFDGQPSSMVQVFRVGQEDALEVANTVRDYVEDAGSWLPEGASLTIWKDTSEVLVQRRDLLLKNGFSGLALVIIVLTLFLRLRLAFWVSLGIPISFLGSIALFPVFDTTINLISLFAFIVVLGIVVDDAIVVGESIFTHYRRHGNGFRAAIEGTREVALPVTFGVLTTVVGFIPLFFIPGIFGKIFGVIPAVVIPVLLFSLVESKSILPAHLKHLKGEGGETGWMTRIITFVFGSLILLILSQAMSRAGVHISTITWVGIPALAVVLVVSRYQKRIGESFERFVKTKYTPLLGRATRWRYVTLAIGFATAAVTFSLIPGGIVKVSPFPPVEADEVVVRIDMPLGTPVEETERALDQIQAAADELEKELMDELPEDSPKIFRHRLTSIGYQPSLAEGGGPTGPSEGQFSGSHLGEVAIELSGAETRSIGSREISQRWKERIGQVPGADRVSFVSSLFDAGDAIDIQLASPNVDELERVADKVKAALSEFAGVSEISDSYDQGKQELRVRIKPEGQSLGLTQLDVARQVRQAFFGEEAQRIQRGRNEIKVMVRYPEDERESLGDFESMRVRLPDGTGVPLLRVADVEMGQGFSTINRDDRRRVVNVTAAVDESTANANEILGDFTNGRLVEILRDHPRVTYTLEGEQREQADSFRGLFLGFVLAQLVIYAMMAIPFRSYLHPAVVMTSVPFGLVGAIFGHMILGEPLSQLSFIGILALVGVVVNDSLVLVDYINRRRREGMDVHEAVMVAGPARFRAVILTSLTTFMGLLPLLLEKSLQAQFLIPLGISLGFGIIFATFVTLFLVPCQYLLFEDLARVVSALVGRLRGLMPSDSGSLASASARSVGSAASSDGSRVE